MFFLFLYMEKSSAYGIVSQSAYFSTTLVSCFILIHINKNVRMRVCVFVCGEWSQHFFSEKKRKNLSAFL